MRYWHSRHNPELTISSQEIQHISQTISRTYHPLQFSQAEPLNFPQLIILPIDPYHLHAYWRIAGATPLLQMANSPLILRLFWQIDWEDAQDHLRPWFDACVVSAQANAKIELPVAGAIYTAAIGQCDNNGDFIVYVRSQPVIMPSSAMTPVTALTRPLAFDEADIDAQIRQTLGKPHAEDIPFSPVSPIHMTSAERVELRDMDSYSSSSISCLQI
ncbi:DUF4912 domain-containing protein [Methylotuvimicrobium buryatense]|uniref:DUF4912 domain-containing protein n=1 Tax=Methylotuvimicrobium buryatense TaxID=95641 RepID=A0A4P9UUD7_METBY|nr:DUF4912 domain-containing protein [Methylotuvimicrobium buryatense]QCW84031.1 DUF4912 domain-containing protein [Methylotuvimicrobium buryatense]